MAERRKIAGMSPDEVLALPVSVPLTTAARALGISQAMAYDLNRRGEFPVPVLKHGKRFIVPRHQIVLALGLDGGSAEVALSEDQVKLVTEAFRRALSGMTIRITIE